MKFEYTFDPQGGLGKKVWGRANGSLVLDTLLDIFSPEEGLGKNRWGSAPGTFILKFEYEFDPQGHLGKGVREEPLGVSCSMEF